MLKFNPHISQGRQKALGLYQGCASLVPELSRICAGDVPGVKGCVRVVRWLCCGCAVVVLCLCCGFDGLCWGCAVFVLGLFFGCAGVVPESSCARVVPWLFKRFVLLCKGCAEFLLSFFEIFSCSFHQPYG